jgi:replicative DNA helicase
MSVYELPNYSDQGGPDRLPPQDIAAEASVLGSMLLSKDAIGEVTPILKVEDFYRPNHQAIYSVIQTLFLSDTPADAVTVASELTKLGELTKVGGAAYLHTLVSGVPTAANADYYAQIVKDRAILRRLVEVGTRITQMGYSGTGEVDDLVDRAQSEVFGVNESRSEDFKPLSEVMPVIYDELEAMGQRKEGLIGVPTGFYELDDLTQGFQKGQLIIVAGRPGQGKTTLGMDFVRSASLKHNMPTAFFSLEMSNSEIVMRMLAAESGIPLTNIRHGQISESQWGTLAVKMGEIAAKPLYLDDSPNLTMMEIRAKARRLVQRHGIRMIVVDYIQLMTSGKKVESRQQEVSEFSRQMKLMAKELNIPVVALSQLNRGPENRSDKRPVLSDLRESGSLEQDADIVIMISREMDKESPKAGEAELIIGKHRNGITKDIQVAFQAHKSCFTDMPRGI